MDQDIEVFNNHVLRLFIVLFKAHISAQEQLAAAEHDNPVSVGEDTPIEQDDPASSDEDIPSNGVI